MRGFRAIVPTLHRDHILKVLTFLSGLNKDPQYDIRINADLCIFNTFTFGYLIDYIDNVIDLGVDDLMECYSGSFQIRPSIEDLRKLILYWFKKKSNDKNENEPNLQITDCKFWISKIIDKKEQMGSIQSPIGMKMSYKIRKKSLGILKIDGCLTGYELTVRGTRTNDVIVKLTRMLTEPNISSTIKYEEKDEVLQISYESLEKKHKKN